ncbi:MAG: hypothetical protein ACON4E_00570 [Flavobacteriales bacterium]
MKNSIALILFLLPFLSVAQSVDCINQEAINPNCICGMIYEPVCGCDGILYSNPCLATECNGVSYYVSAYDENGNLMDCANAFSSSVCDSIEVSLTNLFFDMDLGEPYLEMSLNTFFQSDQTFAYAGFTLLDLNDEIIAYEDESAANVYGFGSNYSDNRQLLLDTFIELPFSGNLILYEGYFSSDNPQMVCVFPVTFDIDGATLQGQYYLSSEDDYVEITEDSILVYDFEQDMECYESMQFAYSANDSIIFLSNQQEEEMLIFDYQNDDNLIFYLPDSSTFVFDTTTFNTDQWQACSDCSINDLFVQSGECDSMGYFMATVEFEVMNAESMDFTIQGNGNDYGEFQYGNNSYSIGPLLGDGTTQYEFAVIDSDNMDCTGVYELGIVECTQTSSIMIYTDYSRSLKAIKNMIGENITSPQPFVPYLYIYEDGSYEKKIFFE